MSSVVEIWKDVIGYEGFYKASNEGKIKSLSRLVKSRWKGVLFSHPERIIRPLLSGKRYLAVNLHRDGHRCTRSVHQIIAETFIGPRPSGYEINHKNGIKTDNHITNLEYVTKRENIDHAVKNGLVKPSKGECNSMARLSKENVISIRQRSIAGECSDVLAEEFGITSGYVYQIVTRRRWAHLE